MHNAVMMDVKIEKRNSKYKIIVYIAGAVLVLGALAWLMGNSRSIYKISAGTVLIDEVQPGVYTDQLAVNATVASLHSFMINVPEGGAVQKLYAEDGQMVKSGEPLLQVSNPAAEVSSLSQQAGVEQQINQVRSSELDLQNQALNLQKELIAAQNDYNLAQQEYARQQRLLADEIGRRADYDRAAENYTYQKKRISIIQTNLKQANAARPAQMQALKRSLGQLQQSGQALEANRQNFLIKAQMPGRLTSFTPVVGQSLAAGQNIGKIDLLDGYKLIANIDEYYLSKLTAGVAGTVQVNGADVPVRVSKILPEIKNGQFTAEIVFIGTAPQGLRIGMGNTVTLKLSEPKKSLLLPKGEFYKESNGKWAYVVGPDNKAAKKTIKLGRENNLYYEVLGGLKAGDKVITSDYHEYSKYNELQITDNK